MWLGIIQLTDRSRSARTCWSISPKLTDRSRRSCLWRNAMFSQNAISRRSCRSSKISAEHTVAQVAGAHADSKKWRGAGGRRRPGRRF